MQRYVWGEVQVMDIEKMAFELKLPYMRLNYQMVIDEAKHTNMGYLEFINTILERELELRRENGLKNRLRCAKFPIKKYLEDFDRSKYSNEFREKFSELESLGFIKNKENIVLIGTPGSGKTHYSIALGIKACLEGNTVLFTSVPNLIIELKKAMSQNRLNTYKRKFERYHLVILDSTFGTNGR